MDCKFTVRSIDIFIKDGFGRIRWSQKIYTNGIFLASRDPIANVKVVLGLNIFKELKEF